MSNIDENENLISASEAGRLVSAHDGDVALLFLYSRLHGGVINREAAARDLCRTMSDISAAEEKLMRMGLTGHFTPAVPAPAVKLPPADELPEYRSCDITRRSQDDPEFSAIVLEAQKALGHTLSTVDLKKLFGFYDYLALPAEVILVLLNYCVSTSKGRRPSMNYIEKQAYRWADLEILTAEQAEEYVSSCRRQSDSAAKLGRIVGIYGRELTPTEEKYIRSWVEMGFDSDAVSIAYDRTVTNTGSMRWTYINKILMSWHNAGIHTGAEVQAKDPRRSRTAKISGQKAGSAESQKISLPDLIKSTENF